MILIVFPFPEDVGIKVVKASLERQKDFFDQLTIGKVKNEKARAEKILAKCKKLTQKGKRVDAIVILRSSLLGSEQTKLSYVPRDLNEHLAQFIEEQKLSRAKFKPEFSELSKTDFPIQLKTLGNFSPFVVLLEFSFNKAKLGDYDLRKFRRKKSSPELLMALKYLKAFLKNLEEHSRKKAAAVSRKRSKEVSEKSGSLEDLAKQLIAERKKIDAEQDKTKKAQLDAEWRKNGEEKLFSLFREIIWQKITEKSPYTLELGETTDAAGRSLLIKMPGRIIADVFLSGTGALQILKRSGAEQMSLTDFYEKICKGELPIKWKEKFGIK